ncbi:MAG: hypothetical protein KAR54_01320 [Candidatus Pacebacteria bacterium]|nr:hypothetical protein [Candidatus Paceibacterota bacterium]
MKWVFSEKGGLVHFEITCKLTFICIITSYLSENRISYFNNKARKIIKQGKETSNGIWLGDLCPKDADFLKAWLLKQKNILKKIKNLQG